MIDPPEISTELAAHRLASDAVISARGAGATDSQITGALASALAEHLGNQAACYSAIAEAFRVRRSLE